MTGSTILVTGVTRFLASSLAGRLVSQSGVDRVIGVDAVMPDPAARRRMGEADFVRADIRHPLIARVLDAAGVDIVAHASASTDPADRAARSMAKEMNVFGTLQLLAACQRSDTVRRVVVRSTAAVYGASSRDPAVVTEDMTPRQVPSSGLGRDAIDIEGYVRGFARRRPDVQIVLPRFADILGPTVRTSLSRYFSLSPVVPTMLGRDARMQFVHETDAVAVLERLVLGQFTGPVNVAGAGTLTVHQAIHRAGRIPLPVPGPALDGVGGLFRLARIRGFAPELPRLLTVGRVLDTRRLLEQVGYRPRYDSVAAFDDFARTLLPVVPVESVRRWEERLDAAIGTPAPLGTRPPAESGRPRLRSVDGGRAGRPRLRAGR